MKCPECESDALTWFAGVRNTGMAVDGRLKTSEVVPVAYLACGECSETVKYLKGTALHDFLNTRLGDNASDDD